jgi:hypothetical protein
MSAKGLSKSRLEQNQGGYTQEEETNKDKYRILYFVQDDDLKLIA